MHDTTESKDKAAGLYLQKKGLRKGYNVLKKEMKEYEDALGYKRDTQATATTQSNWDKYAYELKKRTPGHPKQTINYNGMSADYVSTGMLFGTRNEKIQFVNCQRAKDRLAFLKQLSVDDARTWSLHSATQVVPGQITTQQTQIDCLWQRFSAGYFAIHATVTTPRRPHFCRAASAAHNCAFH